jgi:hypothetical protein
MIAATFYLAAWAVFLELVHRAMNRGDPSDPPDPPDPTFASRQTS